MTGLRTALIGASAIAAIVVGGCAMAGGKAKQANPVAPNGRHYLSQPLVTSIYTADPSAHVFGGKIYIYPSHDVPTAIPDEPVNIRVDNSGDGFVARVGDVTVRGDRAVLKAKLEEKRQQLEKAGSKIDKTQVVLMPGRNVKYNNLIMVYEAALRAGFTKVGFATSH